NNPTRPIAPPGGSFLAVRARVDGKTVARTLGARKGFSWPTIRDVRATSGYPVAEIDGSDPDLPVAVRVSAFSPVIPYNLKDSSLPAAMFTVTLTNRGSQVVDAAVAFSWENLLGYGGTGQVEWADRSGNTQSVREVDGLRGVVFTTPQAYSDRRRAVLGQYALLASVPGGKTDALPYWNAAGDGSDFWDGFTGAPLFPHKPEPRP